MKTITVTRRYLVSIPDGATHYQGDLADMPLFWKCEPVWSRYSILWEQWTSYPSHDPVDLREIPK